MASPILTVQLDDGTGTFPYDISAYVMASDGYEITRGRDDWQGAVTAGQLTLTLNNSDGRFTPGSTIMGTASAGFGAGGFGAGPFGGGSSTGSPIVVDQRIRLKETVNGVTYTRFTGYVKAWPVSWPATVTSFAEVRLTATDAQAKAERRTLRSALEEQVLANSPTAYYTLAEATGAVAAGDTSGNGTASLTTSGSGVAPTFGTATGPGIDGLSAPQFFGGKYLNRAGAPSGATPYSLVVWFSTTTATQGLGSYGAGLAIDAGGHLTATFSPTSTITGGVVNDGGTHMAALCFDGTTATLYIDGASSATALTPTAYPVGLTVGATETPPPFVSFTPFAGTISHVATFAAGLTAPQVAAIYGAASASESGTARLTRLAGYAGVSVGSLDGSLTTVSAQALTGASAQDAIQAVTDTELGVTYIDGTGALTFHNRNRVVAKTTPDLTLTSQWVTPDVNPVLDDQQIVNYFEGTTQGTGAAITAANAASQTSHGRYPASQTYLTQTDAETLDRISWTVGKFAEPNPRYGTLTINLFGMTASQAAAVVAAVDVDCWLRVTSMASQNPGGTTTDVVVQGFREVGTGESWAIVCNVVSHSLYAGIFILDSSLLDGTDLLYV